MEESTSSSLLTKYTFLSRQNSRSNRLSRQQPGQGHLTIAHQQRTNLERQAQKALFAILSACFSLLHCACSAQFPSGEGAARLSSIRELVEAHRSRDGVLLRGAITYNGEKLVVQDQTGAVAVSTPAPVSAAIGDQVEVKGDLEMRTGIPLVRDANVRVLWPGSTPLPLAITPDEAAEGAYNGLLVAIEGKLIKVISVSGDALQLTLDNGNQLFTCTLEAGASPVTTGLTPGSTLRCTGVLSFNPPERAFESGTFLVLLRSGSDIHLLSPAPWWTPRHLTFLFLSLLPLLALAYHIHLRNMRARMALIVEERSRIAREIHDTLAQGFAGIALQLQGVNRTMGPQSPATNAHLAMALQMVRRSRAEAHRSIATLRTLHSYEDLAVMMRKLLGQLTDPAGLALTVTQRGTACPLSDEVTSQILRISQETIANTVEHAFATSVGVTILYAANRMTVEIRDDGRGFNPDMAGSVETGHFGLTGIRERAQQIRGLLYIRSGPAGTCLHLEVPISRPTPRFSSFPSLTRRPRFLGRPQLQGSRQ